MIEHYTKSVFTRKKKGGIFKFQGILEPVSEMPSIRNCLMLVLAFLHTNLAKSQISQADKRRVKIWLD